MKRGVCLGHSFLKSHLSYSVHSYIIVVICKGGGGGWGTEYYFWFLRMSIALHSVGFIAFSADLSQGTGRHRLA